MDLQEVDIGSLEAVKGGVNGGEDGLPREAWRRGKGSVLCLRSIRSGGVDMRLGNFTPLIDIVNGAVNILEREDFRAVSLSYSATAFGHDDQLVTGNLVLFDSFANDLF